MDFQVETGRARVHSCDTAKQEISMMASSRPSLPEYAMYFYVLLPD